MNIIAKEFAKNLKNQRVKNGISQQKLSLLCGFDKNYIGLLERAQKRVTLEKVFIIAAALDCSVTDLFPKESPKHIQDMIKLEEPTAR
jgi:transcriptional regulator with XRE-family HTH domain